MTAGEIAIIFGLQTDKGSFSEGMNLLRSLRTAARQLIGVEAIKSLVGFVEHAAEAGTHILGTATALGISTASLQEWSFVARRAGTSTLDITRGISQFERNLREFAAGRGGNRFKDAMRDLGISSDEAAHALSKPNGINDLLFKVADAYKRMGNTGNRAAINMGLFGARARGMAQDLSQGGAALREQIKHLHEIGGVVDDKQLADLKQLNNSIVDMRTAFSALTLQAVGAVAPALTEMASAAAKWIAENRDLISGAIEGAITAVSYAFKALGAVIEWVGNVVHAAMGGDDGATAILIGIAGAIAAVVIPALASMAVAVIAATWPFVLIAAAIGGIAYLVIQLVKHWDEVKEAAKDFIDFVLDGFEMWGDILYATFVQPWIDAWERVKKLAHDAWEYVTSLEWAKSIPVLGWLGEQAGHGVAKLLGGKEGGRDDAPAGMVRDTLPDGSGRTVLHAPDDMSWMAAPAAASPRGTDARTAAAPAQVNVSAPITINGVKDAHEAAEKFSAALERQMRHTFAGVGGATNE